MRTPAIAVLAVGLQLFARDEAMCTQLEIVGSITRMDQQVYRLRCEFLELPPFPYSPPWGDCSDCASDPNACGDMSFYPGYASISVGGPFGTPEELLNPESVVGSGLAGVAWVLYSTTSPTAGFDFRVSGPESALRLDYGVDLEWSHENYVCGNFSGRGMIGEGFSGSLMADLPHAVGDSSPLRTIPDAIESRTWSQLKQLYR